MTQSPIPSELVNHPSKSYAICIKEQISDTMLAWFEGFSVHPTASGETMLIGSIQDQAALHGILACIRDLGLTLISVVPIGSDPGKRGLP